MMTTKYKLLAYFSCQYFNIISGHNAAIILAGPTVQFTSPNN